MIPPDRLAAVHAAGVVAVLRAPSVAAAVQAVEALVAGGIRGIEITYSTPDVAAVLSTLRERYGGDVVLGAGTVLEPKQAAEAFEAGAAFLVSPGTDDQVVRAMLATGATTLAGALTPSEVMHAVRLGAHGVKIFPGALVGPDYLRALRGPFPAVPLMPTGGVSAANLGTWFAAGAFAIGAGSELVSKTDMTEGRWDAIEENARAFAAALAGARSAALPA